MDGDSTISQKFAVSLKSKDEDQNQGKLPDPYFNSKSSIWSKISLHYIDETFLIFVSNLSRQAYESIYRLIGTILKNLNFQHPILLFDHMDGLNIFSGAT